MNVEKVALLAEPQPAAQCTAALAQCTAALAQCTAPLAEAHNYSEMAVDRCAVLAVDRCAVLAVDRKR